MSTSMLPARLRGRGPARIPGSASLDRENTPGERRGWIGVDVGPLGQATRSRAVIPLLVLALLVALGVASLRIDLIRTRYAVAETLVLERSLIEEQRKLIVRKRSLRDPAALTALARERGFQPIGAVRTLVDPIPALVTGTAHLPTVSAGPPAPGVASETADR